MAGRGRREREDLAGQEHPGRGRSPDAALPQRENRSEEDDGQQEPGTRAIQLRHRRPEGAAPLRSPSPPRLGVVGVVVRGDDRATDSVWGHAGCGRCRYLSRSARRPRIRSLWCTTATARPRVSGPRAILGVDGKSEDDCNSAQFGSACKWSEPMGTAVSSSWSLGVDGWVSERLARALWFRPAERQVPVPIGGLVACWRPPPFEDCGWSPSDRRAIWRIGIGFGLT